VAAEPLLALEQPRRPRREPEQAPPQVRAPPAPSVSHLRRQPRRPRRRPCQGQQPYPRHLAMVLLAPIAHGLVEQAEPEPRQPRVPVEPVLAPPAPVPREQPRMLRPRGQAAPAPGSPATERRALGQQVSSQRVPVRRGRRRPAGARQALEQRRRALLAGARQARWLERPEPEPLGLGPRALGQLALGLDAAPPGPEPKRAPEQQVPEPTAPVRLALAPPRELAP
jgi:hypothetical protein